MECLLIFAPVSHRLDRHRLETLPTMHILPGYMTADVAGVALAGTLGVDDHLTAMATTIARSM